MSRPQMLGTSGGMTSSIGVAGARSAVIDKVSRISPGVGRIQAFGISNVFITTSTLAPTLESGYKNTRDRRPGRSRVLVFVGDHFYTLADRSQRRTSWASDLH